MADVLSSTPAHPSLTGTSADRPDNSARPHPRRDAAATSHAAAPPVVMTVHNYLQTLFWTFAAILFCVGCYCVEKYGLIGLLGVLPDDSLYRMFKNPAELPMRVFGLPHFIVALMFMLSSKRMRGVKSIGWLVGLTGVGVAFCWAFAKVGAHENGLALLVFYAYFLVHGFRDEAFFYKVYGDMPKEDEAVHRRIVIALQVLLLGIILALIIPAYQIYAQQKPQFSHPAIRDLFPAEWPYVLRFFSLVGPMAAVTAIALWRIARVFPDGLRGLWRVHAPILFVFGVSTFIVLLALVSGPWSFNAVVLMHFVGWYLFGRWMLRKHPPKVPPTSLWKKMRTTESGFTVLHLGLAAAVVILIALSTYAFGKTGPLEALVGSKSFYYWTIIHVTLSFFPR